jgi:hypothetical protein
MFMADFKETCINWLANEERATFCSEEQKWINKIIKLKTEHPDEVNIQFAPENNHGVLLADVPKSWIKVSPPRKVNYTDEQRAAMAERLAAAREKKNGQL